METELEGNNHEDMEETKDNVPDVAEEIEVYEGSEWCKNPAQLAQFSEKLAEHVKKHSK